MEQGYVETQFVTFIALLILMIFFLLGFLIVDKMGRLLDRYRVKYGFDREIESKEMGKSNQEEKLNRREKYFKRRTFKD